MTKFTLPLRKRVEHHSVIWHESQVFPGVRYALRSVSLGGRIELTENARDLCRQFEFLKAGDAADQLEASLSDLLVRKLYLSWGLADISGLKTDGQPATVESLIRCGPEELTDEILNSIRSEIGLTEDERKNS
jgi:hypothetical protein